MGSIGPLEPLSKLYVWTAGQERHAASFNQETRKLRLECGVFDASAQAYFRCVEALANIRAEGVFIKPEQVNGPK